MISFRSLNKLLLSTVFFLGLTGCAALDVLSPSPDPVTCNIKEIPELPSTNEEGDVVLEEEHQEDLLLYIESLESCVDQIENS